MTGHEDGGLPRSNGKIEIPMPMPPGFVVKKAIRRASGGLRQASLEHFKKSGNSIAPTHALVGPRPGAEFARSSGKLYEKSNQTPQSVQAIVPPSHPRIDRPLSCND